MAQIEIDCPQCGAHYTLGDEMVGSKVQCAECQTKFFIGEDGKPEVEAAIPPSPEPSESIDERRRIGEDDVPAVWEVGDVILHLYEVTGVLGEGGMGKVYKVRHKGWNVDLAVKCPKPEMFSRAGGAENFERECEAWIDLGLHPHTVSCYYVRRLGGIPRVFAEYVGGGSLQDWIRDQRLYEGGPEKALERMLDIAIQFAWGLHYAHERGLIHQDVKPANVMLTADGLAKFTDFGLARARAVAGETSVVDSDQSILVSTGGMTPAYCSPEQGRGEKLSRRTDIWSWGLSVLEMFTGEVSWRSGTLAVAALENFLEFGTEEEAIPKLPKDLVELLRHCFQDDPEERPKNFRVVADRMKSIYQTLTGDDYTREFPEAAKVQAAALNNHAVSMLDLGRPVEAEILFDQALTMDLGHPQATHNRGLHLWRTARGTDDLIVQALEQSRTNRPGDWNVPHLLALVHLERRDADGAMAALLAAEKLNVGPETQQSLGMVRGMETWALKCLRTFEGHVESVESVVLSADGRWALSGGGDSTLRLWEVSSGKCVRTFEGHTGSVKSVALSADGHWALSGSRDKTPRLWEVSTGKCVRTFEGHTEWVSSVALSADARWALSGSGDKTLRLWEVSTGKCVRTFKGHGESVTSVALSADARWALSGSRDKTLRLWEVSSGKCVRTFEGHGESVMSVALSADARWALSGSRDKTLRLWEVEWNYEFPEPADWDEGAKPSLEIFLTLRCAVGADGFTRVGKPMWTEQDFQKLLIDLQYRGYGWLRPEGVRRQLEKMAAEWNGPPPLTGTPDICSRDRPSTLPTSQSLPPQK